MVLDDSNDKPANELTARAICQVLREVVLERRHMTEVGAQSWDAVYAGPFEMNVEGWHMSIYNDCDELDYCEQAVSPDGQRWGSDAGARTDPIALL